MQSIVVIGFTDIREILGGARLAGFTESLRKEDFRWADLAQGT
jgi:hypothetical protein